MPALVQMQRCAPFSHRLGYLAPQAFPDLSGGDVGSECLLRDILKEPSQLFGHLHIRHGHEATGRRVQTSGNQEAAPQVQYPLELPCEKGGDGVGGLLLKALLLKAPRVARDSSSCL